MGIVRLITLCFGITKMGSTLQVKKEQRWQVIGTVGVEEKSSEVQTVKCSDFQMAKPTLLLMGELSDHTKTSTYILATESS